jgi:hypothetical protein
MSGSSKTSDFIVDSPAEKWFSWLEQTKLEKWSAIITLLFGIYVRWTVGLNSYSGKASGRFNIYLFIFIQHGTN